MDPASLAPGALDGAVRGGAEPGVGVGYHQAHPGEPAGSQRAQEALPDPSLSLSPMSHPRISRLPSVVTPVATTIAIETTW